MRTDVSGVCNSTFLTGKCDTEEWRKFLEVTCNLCVHSVCLSRWSLHDLASRSWEQALGMMRSRQQHALRFLCRSGYIAAALVLLQIEGRAFLAEKDTASTFELLTERITERVSISKNPANSLDAVVRPFPFNTNSWTSLQKFTPALAGPSCWGEGAAGEARSRHSKLTEKVTHLLPPGFLSYVADRRPILVPVPDNEPLAKWCPLRASHAQLARVCRSRATCIVHVNPEGFSMQLGPGRILNFPTWHCPDNVTLVSDETNDSKYTHYGRRCDGGFAMWGKPLEHHTRCIAIVVGQMLQVKPGSTVLDWGSGCGWMLTWLHLIYGSVGYGIDATPQAYDWSSQHSAGKFCLTNGIQLDWVPTGGFDHVISYWALYHITPASRLCKVASQLVSKLRPGGRAWFGGNDPSEIMKITFTPFSENQWIKCLNSLSKKGFNFKVEFFEDVELFRTETFSGSLPGDYLYFHPTYSTFVTRLS